MELIDSHCHLQGFQKKGALEAVLARAASAGVVRLIAVGTSPEDWVDYRQMHEAHRGRIDYTVGLHPCYVTADWADDVRLISTFFMPPAGPVALGEIGLDYFHLPKDPVEAGEQMLLQEAAFRQQLSLAGEIGCPVVIHSRDSFADCVKCIDESEVDWGRVVFHCYSYGSAEMAELIARGARASFTGIATYKSAEPVREALVAQGCERLMLETDSPYLAPEPHRGTENEPALVAAIARSCAATLGIEPEALAAHASANTRAFFMLE